MTVRLTAISLCPGGNHVTVTATLNGGQSQTRTYLKSDLAIDPNDDVESAILARLRSAVKESGATTNAQISQALLNKDFQI